MFGEIMSVKTLEITTDDVENVVYNDYDKNIDWSVASDIIELINSRTLDESSSDFETIDEQNSFIMDYLSKQIKESKEIQDIISRA